MESLLKILKTKCSFLESRSFSRLSWAAAILGPLPLSTQLYKAATAPSVEGIAIEAYSLLCIMHLIMVGRGIKALDGKIAVAFTLTSVIAGSIAVTALIRGGTFILW